jgi:hypothetical protein
VTGVNPITNSSLQFAVGTANIGGLSTGMNVLVTMRQPNGQSAVLVSTPALSGPFTLPAPTAANSSGATVTTGPSGNETGSLTPLPVGCPAAPCIAGIPQQTPGTPVSSYPYISTFGTSGGTFGIGFAPANYTSSGVANSTTPYRIPEYAIPAGFSSITPWGGPPAYDPNGSGRGSRDGTFPLVGVPLGISVFNGVTVGAGTYTLNVQIPSTGGVGTITATSTRPAGVVLPTVAAPIITTAAGGGTITVTAAPLPAGITNAYVQILNSGGGTCAAGTASGATAYYTFAVGAAGGAFTVNNTNAPLPGGTNTSVAACTGDAIRAWVIGFDYNHYALTYNGLVGSTYPQTPALPASADISISPQTNFTAL